MAVNINSIFKNEFSTFMQYKDNPTVVYKFMDKMPYLRILRNMQNTRQTAILIRLLDREKNSFVFTGSEQSMEDHVEINLLGSTSRYSEQRNKYCVKIYDDGRLSCDCLDFHHRCSKTNEACKHICFVVFELGKGQIANEDFFKNSTLTQEQRDNLLEFINAKEMFYKSDKDITCEDLCPVCFDDINTSQKVSCPKCKNYVHEKCMKTWLVKTASCVYCRDPIWDRF
jgi:hypothetical protein